MGEDGGAECAGGTGGRTGGTGGDEEEHLRMGREEAVALCKAGRHG